MDPTSIIPSIGQSEPRENGQNKKKERSLVEDVKAIKNIFDKAKMLANPATPWIVGALTLILIFFLFFNNSDSAKGTSGGSGSGNQPTPPVGGNNPTVPSIPGLSISITGPESINNGEDISYTINVTYDKSLAKTLLENIELYATIPTGAVYKPELSSGEPIEPSATPVVWPLSNTKNQQNFTVVLHPDVVDAYISFTIAARVVGGGTGSLVGLLPSSTVSTPEIDVQHQAIATKIKSLTELVRAYQDAEKVTGMPWQILAGIHYREGGLDPNGSLVSGRPIGSNEPDIVAGGGCLGTYSPGSPVALSGGGCGFRTFTDSAIYAANHLKDKIGSIPTTFQDLAKALSKYNGGGNSNCGEGVAYNFCPPDFYGDDDPYAMNLFDQKHQQMFVIFCADNTRCNPPRLDSNLGTLSVILALSKYF